MGKTYKDKKARNDFKRLGSKKTPKSPKPDKQDWKKGNEPRNNDILNHG